LFLIRFFFLGAKRVGVLSEIEKNEFIKKFGYPKKMIVVKNIVLPNKPTDNKEFNLFSRDPLKIYCLYVSRIIKGKGLDDLIRSLPLVLKTNPHFKLVVVGDGPERIPCSELANELKMKDSIIWLGTIPNDLLLTIYNFSDIFIFPSHFPEGMPMALVEALRSGIPIITTRVRFAVYYLVENKNCLFIEAGDINDITNKIKKLLANKDLQMKMKAINPIIVEEFSQEIVGKEFEIIYEQMLNA
jgi:glycosyltransferase involved in cell wall biosynthesis